MPANPDISIVAPTFRRPSSLAALLRGLHAQVDPGGTWEVVVVDNEPEPGVEAVVRDTPATTDLTLRYIREPEPGASHARNRGVAEAAGRIVAFIDDDVAPEPTWLRELVAPLLERRCEGTGGRVVLDPEVRRPEWFDDHALGGYLSNYDLGDEERPLEANEYLLTASAAFDIDLVRRAGGFDPRLGPKGRGHLVGDDVLLTRRVMDLGGRIRYVPSAVVVHELPPERLRVRYLLKRAFAQGRTDWLVNREALAPRRLNGARVAGQWLSNQLRRRREEGLTRRDVRFHALLDVVRTAGAAREMLAWSVESVLARAPRQNDRAGRRGREASGS